MENFKRFLITTDADWCGMDEEYGAYALCKEDLYDLAQMTAYDNYFSYGGDALLLDEYFPDREETTDEMLDYIAEISEEYYNYSIEDFTEDDEYWESLPILYDGRQENNE